MLLMNVKGCFDQVSKDKVMRMIDELGVDGNLYRWAGSLMSEKKVSIGVDGYHYETVEVETGVPQRSPVSHIPFPIYPSRIFKEVEKQVEGCMTTLFAYDCR